MSRANYIAIAAIAAIAMVSGFFVYSYRTTFHTWKLDSTLTPEFAASCLANQEGVSEVTSAREQGALVVQYIEKNALFRSQVDVPSVLSKASGKEPPRVLEHTTQ